MEISIKINTIYNNSIDINILTGSTIGYLKSIIQDAIGIHPDCIYLYHNNVLLNDNLTLSNYDIKNNSIIYQSDRIIY